MRRLNPFRPDLAVTRFAQGSPGAAAGPAGGRAPGTALIAMLVALTAAVAGCATAVRIEPPAPSGSAAAACRDLGAALPRRLDGLDRGTTEPASPYVAVWGDGQIALRCGVPRPAAMTPTSTVIDVNGVGWFQDPRRPTLFTSVNREAYVEVTISREHVAGAVLLDLAAPIKAAIPE